MDGGSDDGDEAELTTERHEASSWHRRGGVIVTRDAPDSVDDGGVTPGSVVSDPGANDTIRPEALADRQRRDAERGGEGGGDAATAPVRSRLPLGMFGLVAGLLVIAAVTVAVATNRLRPKDW